MHAAFLGVFFFVRFAEREMSVAEFPADYAFGDGKDEGFSTPNFPLGEFANAEAREAAEKAGTSSVEASWCWCWC